MWTWQAIASGGVQAGSGIELIERPHPRLSIRMMNKILAAPEEWPDLAYELAASPATTDGWRRKMSRALSEIEG